MYHFQYVSKNEIASLKKSRSIFADAIHQVCRQNGYFEE